MTTAYARVGGLAADLYDGFADEVRALLREIVPYVQDVLKLVKRNRIFMERTVGAGAIAAADAICAGWTGPCLRACGVPLDARKRDGYYFYDEFDFDVVIGENGDSYDRIMVRFEEIFQSIRIIEQALDKLPGGPVNTPDNRYILPPKEEVYRDIEPLMNHFMLVMFGVPVPPGETYDSFEVPNGELGFHVISDGRGRPYRVRVRPPCFYIYSAYPRLIDFARMREIADSVGAYLFVDMAQNALTQDIRQAAARGGRAELLSMWAGQAVPLATARSAGEVVETTVAQAREVLRRLR